MAQRYSIHLDPNSIFMSAIDSRQVKGFLNKNGIGFSGRISFLLEAGAMLTIDNQDYVFSDKNGNFTFTIKSKYYENKHSTGAHPSIEKKVGVLYIADGDELLARNSLSVLIKPDPI